MARRNPNAPRGLIAFFERRHCAKKFDLPFDRVALGIEKIADCPPEIRVGDEMCRPCRNGHITARELMFALRARLHA